MTEHHGHNKSNHHHHHHHGQGDIHGQRLLWAVVANVLLTVAQLIGGILSGSLALIADAVHNLSDAGALALAAFARRVAGLPPSERMTFGFGRAEILGALVSSSSLVVVAGYILYESIERFYHPQEIEGWMVIGVATLALFVDLVTAALTFRGSKESLNIRAAFIHNLSDAMASVAVIISGSLILWWKLYWADLVASILISLYILYHSYFLIRECLAVLMQAVPDDLDPHEVKRAIKVIKSVVEVHHVHIWQLHERFRSLEAHLVISSADLQNMEKIKREVRSLLREQFRITHSTLEIEVTSDSCCGDCGPE